MSEAPAKLLWNGKEIELPVVRTSRGLPVVEHSPERTPQSNPEVHS